MCDESQTVGLQECSGLASDVSEGRRCSHLHGNSQSFGLGPWCNLEVTVE